MKHVGCVYKITCEQRINNVFVKFPVEEGSSIIVCISHCRGIRLVIFQTTSCKAVVIYVVVPLQSVIDMQSLFLRHVQIVPLFSLSGCTTYWYWHIIIKGILPYRKGSIVWRSRSLWIKIGSFLPVQYLWSFAMIRLLTSYSKDKREKGVKYWSFSQKVKGQPFCSSLVALYLIEYLYAFKSQMHPTSRNRWRVMIGKYPEHQGTKRLLVKVSKGCLPIELCIFVIFLWILQASVLRTCCLL